MLKQLEEVGYVAVTDEIDGLIKAKSVERRLEIGPEKLNTDYSVPGRLIMIRTDVLKEVPLQRDGKFFKALKDAGYEAGIATGLPV